MNFADYRAETALPDGTPAVIRAIRPEDRTTLQEGFKHLSERTIYHRFLGAKRDLTDAELRYFTELDFLNHIGLVVELPSPGGPQPIAVGRAVRIRRAGPVPSTAPPSDSVAPAVDRPGPSNPPSPPGRAEVAFVVLDRYQGHGIGTLLLEHLVGIARQLGYSAFEAEVLPSNRQMLEVFANSGLPQKQRIVDGLVHVEMEL